MSLRKARGNFIGLLIHAGRQRNHLSSRNDGVGFLAAGLAPRSRFPMPKSTGIVVKQR